MCRNRFVYDVFIEDDWRKVVLEFGLEIVGVQGKQLGIQRKRTKGNSWHYKRCYEDIVRQLTRLLSHIPTSYLNSSVLRLLTVLSDKRCSFPSLFPLHGFSYRSLPLNGVVQSI